MSGVNRQNGNIIGTYSQFSQREFYFGYFDNWRNFFEENQRDREEIARSNAFFKRRYYDPYEKSSIAQAESKMGVSFKSDETQTIEDLNSGFFGTYSEQDILDNTIQSFDEMLSAIDMGGSFKKSKLIISDRPQGIFDFGLASLGLFNEQEFYSETLAKESPLEFPSEPSGIVPPLFVEKNELGDFWYFSKFTNNKYNMTQQDKGTQQAILDGYNKDNIPSSYKTFKTRQKKSYLLFKKEGGKAKKVDLYIPMGGNRDLTQSGMLARALPVIMAARYFESVGIRTRVNATRLYYTESYNIDNQKDLGTTYQCVAIKIKDFGEDVDFTRMAISVADNRTFRWGLWKYLPAFLAKKYGVTNEGYGYAMYGGSDFLETSRRFKNWYSEEIEKGVPLVPMEKTLQIFGGLENPPSSYTYTGKVDQTYKDIVEAFYKILDTVDIYYNKPKDAYNRIYKRWVETNNRTVREMKTYIQGVLSNSYSVALGGKYSDIKEDADKIEDDFDEKIDSLNEFLTNIQTP
jgi:hypothetical protein